MLDLRSIGVTQSVPIFTSPSERIVNVAGVVVDLIELLLLLMESLSGTTTVTWLLTMTDHDYTR